jgi:hypothetical protein
MTDPLPTAEIVKKNLPTLETNQQAEKIVNIYANATTINTSSTPLEVNILSLTKLPPLSTEYYNLFIADGLKPTKDTLEFSIPVDMALTKYISGNIREKYATLSSKALEDIYNFPSLFLSRTPIGNPPTTSRIAYIGFIEHINISDRTQIMVTAHASYQIYQRTIDEDLAAYAIAASNIYNELYKTHWTIKKLDLLKVLRAHNVNIPS